MFNVQWEPTLVEDNKSANPNVIAPVVQRMLEITL